MLRLIKRLAKAAKLPATIINTSAICTILPNPPMLDKMRIIGGEFRGRRLAAPKGKGTRPSTERVREALFNILGDRILDSRFLDLFAGTGAIGLEALSRGAERVVFVERQREALRSLRQNIADLGVEERSHVMALDATSALRKLAQREQFCIVYADPPYGQTQETIHDLLRLLENSALLSPHASVFIEESISLKSLPPLASLELKQSRRYGRTLLWEFQ